MKVREWQLVNKNIENSVSIYWQGYLPHIDYVRMKTLAGGIDKYITASNLVCHTICIWVTSHNLDTKYRILSVEIAW